jgi:tellurite resistance protein TerC
VFLIKRLTLSTKEASKWTSIWVTLSLLFSGVIYWIYDNNYIANPDGLKPLAASIKFITGYLIS